MITFKFCGRLIGNTLYGRKYWFPNTNYLKNNFKFEDVKANTFSNTIHQRLQSAKKDGIIIPLMKHRNIIEIGIEVINSEDRQKIKEKNKQAAKEWKKEIKILEEKQLIGCSKIIETINKLLETLK